jgi:hypothetical protein
MAKELQLLQRPAANLAAVGYIGGERISGATRSVIGSGRGLKPNLPFLDEPSGTVFAKSGRDLLARGIFTTVAI